jgi:hypothetical protein
VSASACQARSRTWKLACFATSAIRPWCASAAERLGWR